jgi:hypothetical protein
MGVIYCADDLINSGSNDIPIGSLHTTPSKFLQGVVVRQISATVSETLQIQGPVPLAVGVAAGIAVIFAPEIKSTLQEVSQNIHDQV